ncbi:ABC transporter permease [Texcoconibacillus texcoconensis]|uniref:ABC-2 type transport system permease protein n=1 Tax=Texcoconibacillus texcoconensis TaxID=1095777 RepID=A0A840QPG9_9BACI|nr:ABC transporter permease [Texcoconibacillus texcoconensis]MBB5173231.1 ABC-2 type transport system permease protein [Texcoconibacillus texcoconensis]
MINIQSLWSKRVKEYWRMAIRYLRLIGNSGFLFTVYILIVFGSYYYGIFLDELPASFPTEVFLALVFALFLSKVRVRTFLKEADVVFLSPLEGKIDRYFRTSFFYSLAVQSAWLLLLTVIVTPMYADRITANVGALFASFLAFVLLIAWNMYASFNEQRLQERGVQNIHLILRFVANVVMTLFVFHLVNVFVLAIGFIILALITATYYQRLGRNHSLKWDQLVEIEDQMLTMFYRIANSFTDVPRLKTKVRARKLLTPVLRLVPYAQQRTFHYLYSRAFLRSNDYFGIYMRLTIVGSLLLIWIQTDWAQWFIVVLFTYMTGLQIATLYRHFHTNHQVDLYPIAKSERQQAVQAVVFCLLLLQVAIFTVVIVSSHSINLQMFIAFVLGVGTSGVFTYGWMRKKLLA